MAGAQACPVHVAPGAQWARWALTRPPADW